MTSSNYSTTNSIELESRKLVQIAKVYINTQGKVVSIEVTNTQQNKDAIIVLLTMGCTLTVPEKFKVGLNNSTCIIPDTFLSQFFKLWGFTYSFKTLASERVFVQGISYGDTKQIGYVTGNTLKNPKSVQLNSDCFIKEVLLADDTGSFTVPAKLFYAMARFLNVFSTTNIKTQSGKIYLTKWHSKLIKDSKGRTITEREFKLILDFIEKYRKSLPSNVRKIALMVTSMFIDNAYYQGSFGVEVKDDGTIKFLTLEDSMKVCNGQFSLVKRGTSLTCTTMTFTELFKK